MSKTHALSILVLALARDLLRSGLTTARVILSPSLPPAGLARLAYGDLPEHGASLLAFLLTLTPGTTAVEIDTERREILLHLLDARAEGITLTAIERHLAGPLRVLFGCNPRP